MKETEQTALQNPARVVIPMGIAITLSLLGDLALFASLPMNVAAVGISVANLGLIFGIHRLIRIPGNTLGGMLMNHRRRRPFFITGLLLAVLSTLGYAFSYDLTTMVLSRLGWGMAWILLYICSLAMVIDVTHENNRGKWMGVFNTWYLMGIAGGSLLGGFLSDQIGFQPTMVVCAGLTVIGLIEAVILLPETNQRVPASDPTNPKNVGKQPFWPTLSKRFSSFNKLIFSTPGLTLVLLLYMVNQFAAEGVALSVLSLLLKDRLGEGILLGMLVVGISSLNGFLLAFRYLLSAIISPLAGSLSDRVQHGRVSLLTGGLGISIISFLLIGYGHSLIIILAGIFLNAIGGGAVLVALGALLGDLTPKNAEGKMLGVYATAGDIGSALGPMFAYFLLSYVHVSNVFLVCGVLFSVGLVFVLRGFRKKTSLSV